MIVTMHKKLREMQCHIISTANQLQNLLDSNTELTVSIVQTKRASQWRIKGVADWATARGPQHLRVP